ncbi:phosphoglucomutase [Cimex lectularius]|uniref:phosphoglucomutase (alpha-D-glucose-1,6-bisphosphate-dependent) n=1 Tax=Cimex lectularius TaxID=79782 RepID=A0A8I6TCL7_CIMLE|nr:phosphoglucomutase [Cimex lectularius]
MAYEIESVNFRPFSDQQPGTSGLRKNVKVFLQKHYTESFVQSILDYLKKENNGPYTIVLGGDGRYFVKEAVRLIINISAANKVDKIYVGQGGILSTPAASHLIRLHNATGGILLTASHNPGGPDKDFGVKFNLSNGGPATSNVTNEIFEISKKITHYRVLKDFNCSVDEISSFTIQVDGHVTVVEVIDPVDAYVELMKDIFNFEQIRSLAEKPDFNIIVDSMSGVTGPYAKRIFVEELKFKKDCIVCGTPLTDFGGGHPDPNLTYANRLVRLITEGEYEFGVAFDGDGDRNMILGRKGFFVGPSDSLAVIASKINCIKYFKANRVTGFARSMPTTPAVDRVGELKGIPIFETPTGWKYFGNLMDADRVCLCGEESFGTGSNHIREKDGIWAALAWLSIIATLDKGIPEIMTEHWEKFGRYYTTRYDYENVSSESAKNMMEHIEKTITAASYPGTSFGSAAKYVVKFGDSFSYTDPIDGSVAKNQGLRVVMEDGSRIIYRLSGTGSTGATVRIYVEAYEKEKLSEENHIILSDLCDYAIELARIKHFTDRDAPTVIT